MANINLRQLKWVLYRIFLNDQNSKVVVAGDLNKIGMKQTDFLHNLFKLKAVLSKEQATHKLGGHLDNIWTNLQVTSTELIGGLKITDPALISVKLRIDENFNRTLPHKTISFYSGVDIRNTVMNDASIKEILKQQKSLDVPLVRLKARSPREREIENFW